jgi:DNA-binding NarL/FixJ family response regulator
MSIPKWDEARTAALVKFVGDEVPVSLATLAEAATQLETTVRSIAAKLRKEGYDVEKVANAATKTFSDEQEDALRTFLVKNAGNYTFAEIANLFAGGAFSAKQIQGKILSMELTEAVKPTEKKVYERNFSDTDEKTFIKMAKDGKFLEDIADKLSKTVQQVRGKALSLLRNKQIEQIPASKKVPKTSDALDGLDVAEMTVAEIAEKIDRSERGVKTMLTRRGVDAKDYAGAAKAVKAATKKATAA